MFRSTSIAFQQIGVRVGKNRSTTLAQTTSRYASTFASQSGGHSNNQKHSKMTSKVALLSIGVGAGAAAAWSLSSQADAKEKKLDVDAIKEEILDVFEKNNEWGPTFLRLAWHSSGTYCKHAKNGGSGNGSIRLSPEINHGANAGLIHAVKALEPIKKRHPEISYADLYILSGIASIEAMGGPSIPFRTGRVDTESSKDCAPDGRLPDADKGSKEATIQHVRDIFYRMGFNDRDIVALIGAHAVGRCHDDRSGYSGPWTRAEWTFSNEFFRELLENKWTLKKWKGPEQYEDPSGDLMMLPADMALIWDPEFKKYVELYAKDEEQWHKDFAKAFQKLTESGVNFPKSWWRFFF